MTTFDTRCQRIAMEANALKSDASFLSIGDKFLLSDGDLLTAQLSLQAAAKCVDELLALRPSAKIVQAQIEERLDRIAAAARNAA